MASSKQQELWDQAVYEATNAVQTLIDIQDECQGKYDDLSETQQQGEKGEALEKVTDLDLQAVMDTLSDAGNIDIP